jgi:hypothetical protein
MVAVRWRIDAHVGAGDDRFYPLAAIVAELPHQNAATLMRIGLLTVRAQASKKRSWDSQGHACPLLYSRVFLDLAASAAF